MKRILFFPLALSLGCAAAPPFTCPANGGAPWREASSPHFVVQTDEDEDTARRTIAQLESSYAAFQDVLFQHEPQMQGKIRVVLFASEAGYRRIAPPGADAFFDRRPRGPDRLPTMVMHDELRARTRRLFQHELTHRFMAHYFPSAPAWLNEGMATLHETARVEEDRVVLGEGSRRIFFPAGGSVLLRSADGQEMVGSLAEMPSSADLLALDYRSFYVADAGDPLSADARKKRALHYAGAEALVHVLYLGEPTFRAGFRELQQTLITGAADPSTAFEKAFGAVQRTGELEQAYKDYLVSVEISVVRPPFKPQAAAVEYVRLLSHGETHALWATLLDPSDAAAELDHAVDADPQDPEPLVTRGMLRYQGGQRELALEDLKRAAQIGSREPRYLLPLASIYLETEATLPREQRVWDDVEPLAAKIRKRAREAAELDFLARFALLRGDPASALQWAARAVTADVSCDACYETASLIFEAQGQLAEAVQAQQLALQSRPEDQRSERLIRRLRELEARLGKGAPRR